VVCSGRRVEKSRWVGLRNYESVLQNSVSSAKIILPITRLAFCSIHRGGTNRLLNVNRLFRR
jgi:hypothetical protein